MVTGSFNHEIVSPVSPMRLWKAIVKDSHNLMPKLMPGIISSIIVLEGDGGVGTVRQTNFTEAIKDFTYWKERIDAIDDEKRVFKYSVIEGGLLGTKLKSTRFELKFEPGTGGGSSCKLYGEFETLGDSLQTEEQTKEAVGNMAGMFKAIEGYLIENPDAYA